MAPRTPMRHDARERGIYSRARDAPALADALRAATPSHPPLGVTPVPSDARFYATAAVASPASQAAAANWLMKGNE
jgi:hypothetical protein